MKKLYILFFSILILIFISGFTQADILKEDSFEVGDLSAWREPDAGGTGNWEVSREGARHGLYGFVVSVPSSDNWGYRQKVISANVPDVVSIRFSFRVDDYLFNNPELSRNIFQILGLLGPDSTRLFQTFVSRSAENDKLYLTIGSEMGITEVIPGKWHELLVYYKAGSAGRYEVLLDGVQQFSDQGSELPAVRKADLGILITSPQIGGTVSLDDIVISSAPLEPAQKRVRLVHADYFGHLGMTMIVFPELVANDDSLSVILHSDITGETVIYEREAPLPPRFEFDFNLRELPAADYTLTASIINSEGIITAETTETFSKPYDGIPISGIDENNNICFNGEPFFPVTPWGLRSIDLSTWAEGKYMNSLYHTGFGETNLSIHTNYMDQAASLGLPVIGPGRFYEDDRTPPDNKEEEFEVLTQYINTLKDHEATLMWMWGDEPTTVRGKEAEEVRAFTRLSHQLDPMHLVTTNEGGGWFLPGNSANREHMKSISYPNLTADVFGFDVYPFEDRIRFGRKIENLVVVSDIIRRWNYDLIPFMAFIETCDQKFVSEEYDTPEVPTPEQINMMAWLCIVHGAKGINWYHYDGVTPEENFEQMALFTNQVRRLNNVILAAESSLEITDDANEPGRRVDTMIRETDDAIYIFAVRLSEIFENPSAINVTFDLEFDITAIAEVFDEDRTVNVVNGQFTDSFSGSDVNIYRIERDIVPNITRQPLPKTVLSGDDVVFKVNATGMPTLYYQWQKDGQDIIGANSTALILTDVHSGYAGEYSVIVSNAIGNTTSEVATLNVINTVPGVEELKSTVDYYTGYLTWKNPEENDLWDKVIVLRKTDSRPTDHTDGDVVYEGSESSFIDRDLNIGTYHYAIYTYKGNEINALYSEPAFTEVVIPETYNKNYLKVETSQQSIKVEKIQEMTCSVYGMFQPIC